MVLFNFVVINELFRFYELFHQFLPFLPDLITNVRLGLFQLVLDASGDRFMFCYRAHLHLVKSVKAVFAFAVKELKLVTFVVFEFWVVVHIDISVRVTMMLQVV